MTWRRIAVAALSALTLVSFLFVNLGNVLLVDALVPQGLAALALALAASFDIDTPRRRQWVAVAIGEHSGLMAMSLGLLSLGGGTRTETILAAALSVASLALLVQMLRRLNHAPRPAEEPVERARPRPVSIPKPVRRRSQVSFGTSETATQG